jgi:hypothetical protein
MLGPNTPLAAIEAMPLAAAMRQSLWLYPVIEIIHILGFVTLVGSVAMLDLRILGLSKTIPVSALARHILPWTLGAALFVVPSGLLMFVAHAGDFISNTAFITKLSLLSFAACNALWFHVGPYQGVKDWQTGTAAPLAAKASAALSLLLWVAIICCGRLLAYL